MSYSEFRSQLGPPTYQISKHPPFSTEASDLALAFERHKSARSRADQSHRLRAVESWGRNGKDITTLGKLYGDALATRKVYCQLGRFPKLASSTKPGASSNVDPPRAALLRQTDQRHMGLTA